MRHADPAAKNAETFGHGLRRRFDFAHQCFECQYDQGVASQDREAFAVGCVHARFAPPDRGVVETGQIIMNQGCAVH